MIHHNQLKIIIRLICIFNILLGSQPLIAQYVDIIVPQQQSTAPKDTIIPTPIIIEQDLEKLYKENHAQYYDTYLSKLIKEKKYKQAEKVIEDRKKELKNAPQPYPYIDLGYIYQLEGKEKKVNEQFNKALLFINGDDEVTKAIAKKFLADEQLDYAIEVYIRTDSILQNNTIYADIIAQLYGKKGAYDKVLDVLLYASSSVKTNVEHAKSKLLQILGTDPEKLRIAQKEILKRINNSPDNTIYSDILIWIYIQKDDWEGALLQVEALDELNKENGKRLMNFAKTALLAKQFEIAEKAYNEIIAKGSDFPYYLNAQSELLNTGFSRLNENPNYKKGQVDTLMFRYEEFLKKYPNQFSTSLASDYAKVAALYANDIENAISILTSALGRPDIKRELAGTFKLQMGDYYLLIGKIWDASLIYSQVDKEFKQDAMGEDARFRNAKLAYYRGDFKWAQRQLLILKSATSELIANDALYLSVLITENVEDTDSYPLTRFAYADLLLFQNKDREALLLLDSISTAYPKHPLADDILMLHAKIAEKHQQYDTAIKYLEAIHQQYGTDVLGDDAVMKMADIYEKNLKKTEKAKYYFEQLILEYPSSTFVQVARQRLHDLNNPNP